MLGENPGGDPRSTDCPWRYQVKQESELERAQAVKIGAAHAEIQELRQDILNLEQDLEDRNNLIRCLKDALHLKQNNIEKAIHLLNPAMARKATPNRDQLNEASPGTTEQTHPDPDHPARSE